jgi:hypothetical protein
VANILTTNPWSLDGTGLGTVLVANEIKLKHFEFVNYGNGQSSIVKLADRFGHVLWYCTGDTDGVNQRSGVLGWVHGLQEITHTDGIVLVFFD